MTRQLIQCDFDDTVTYKDISLLLLNEFAGPGWRDLWDRLTKEQRGELAGGMFKAAPEKIRELNGEGS